ncbi:hypothetical protein Tco_1345654 [Tanacetum coccineum]
MAEAGRSQRNSWWRPAAILTGKSFVDYWHRGERLIETVYMAGSRPKFPSGYSWSPGRRVLLVEPCHGIEKLQVDHFLNPQRVLAIKTSAGRGPWKSKSAKEWNNSPAETTSPEMMALKRATYTRPSGQEPGPDE